MEEKRRLSEEPHPRLDFYSVHDVLGRALADVHFPARLPLPFQDRIEPELQERERAGVFQARQEHDQPVGRPRYPPHQSLCSP